MRDPSPGRDRPRPVSLGPRRREAPVRAGTVVVTAARNPLDPQDGGVSVPARHALSGTFDRRDQRGGACVKCDIAHGVRSQCGPKIAAPDGRGSTTTLAAWRCGLNSDPLDANYAEGGC
jgi:hypothetical protein